MQMLCKYKPPTCRLAIHEIGRLKTFVNELAQIAGKFAIFEMTVQLFLN